LELQILSMYANLKDVIIYSQKVSGSKKRDKSHIHTSYLSYLLQEQVGEVIDAMFEKRVTVGDCVIQQGADGDNFYVIERFVLPIV